MKKQYHLYGSFSLLLIILLVFGILPITGIAQNDRVTEVIMSFDALVTEATVPAGTEREDISLPKTLMASLEDGMVTAIPITWDDGGVYDKDTAGMYTFTADIGTYLYGQARPVAVVTVTDPSDAFSGSISGRLWLDENADGVMDEKESGVADYPVSLYGAGHEDAAVLTARTLPDGTYCFENLEPGSYVVGISSEIIGETEYLLPVTGISGDNKFEIVEINEETFIACSETLAIFSETDTAVEHVNAGMRLIPGKKMLLSAGNFAQLKSCVSQALDNAVIDITGDITFTEPITTNKSLTFRSATGNFTFAQSNAVRHFIINPSTKGGTIELAFENIVLNGNKKGGGIHVKGGTALRLSLNNSVIRDCTASEGGGLLLDPGATLTLSGGKISGNSAAKDGGGIYVNLSNLTVQSTEISGNSAANAGGGIYVNSGNLTVQSAEVSENTAESEGGGIGVKNGTAYIQGSRICNNSLASTVYTNRSGGGLKGTASEISVKDSEISGNKATSGGGFHFNGGMITVDNTNLYNNNGAFTGGAITLHSGDTGTTLIITGGEISGNRSELGGGGICEESASKKNRVTIEGCSISGNKTASFGGAIMGSGGIVTVINSNISGNTAGYGGAMYIYRDSDVTISGGEISGNAALASAGNFGGGQGGAISGRFDSIITIKDNGKIINNVAESVESDSGRGGGIHLYQSKLIVENGEISGNMAKRAGGGIYSENNGIVEIQAGSIDGNVAPNGGGIYINSLEKLTVASDAAVFKENKAGKANDKSTVDMNLHAQKIFTTHFTTPFDFAYNNFDVGYKITAAGTFCTVNFDSRGGSTVHPKIVEPGSTITPPSPGPTRDNYSFSGWYKNAAGTNPWSFATDTVISDITLYAKWMPGSSIAVSKAVTGDYGDKTKEFTFTICFMNENGNKLSGGTEFLYTGSIVSGSGAAVPAGGTLTLDSNGEAEFTLKHGQQITIAGVPVNSKVQIIETAAAGYTTSFRDGNETNTGADTGVRTLTFTAKTFAFTNSRTAVVPTGVLTGSSIPLVVLALPVLLGVGLSAGKIFLRRRRSL